MWPCLFLLQGEKGVWLTAEFGASRMQTEQGYLAAQLQTQSVSS